MTCILLPLVLAAVGFRARYLADWWLENVAVFIVLAGIAMAGNRLPISEFSWTLMLIFLCFHEYGAFYAYSNAPVGEALKPILHTARNHYDRIVHFLFGLLVTWPVIGWYSRIRGVSRHGSYALAAQTIMAASALYEIMEWWFASIMAPGLGSEFIGAQGDFWDSSADMASALVGTLVAVGIAELLARRFADEA